MDLLFRAAIKRAFDRDAEKAKTSLVSLSGGLDSRMTSWVAHEMGYTNQLNLCFAQQNSLDHTIAQNIAHDLEHTWHFMPLDGGDMLRDVDEVTQHTGGNVVYYGQAHTRRILQEIVAKNSSTTLGMLHTGMLGDVVIGSYLQTPNNPTHFSALSVASSLRFSNQLVDHGFKPNYGNLEHHKIMLRGLYGMNMGLMSVYAVTESYSPFYDVDLFNFCLQLPVELRAQHKLYIHWIPILPRGVELYLGTNPNKNNRQIYSDRLKITPSANLALEIIGKNTIRSTHPEPSLYDSTRLLVCH